MDAPEPEIHPAKQLRSTIKEFSDLSKNQVPALTIERSDVKRTDDATSIIKEMEEMGTTSETETDKETGIKVKVGTTPNPSPHTMVTVSHEVFAVGLQAGFENGRSHEDLMKALNKYDPEAKIPLHLINWIVPTNEKDEIIDGYPKEKDFSDQRVYEQTYELGGESLDQSVIALSAMAPYTPYAEVPVEDAILVYGVRGHYPYEERKKYKLNRGAQSFKEILHSHAVFLPEKAIVEHAAVDENITPKKLLKHLTPFNELFFNDSINYMMNITQEHLQKRLAMGAISPQHSSVELAKEHTRTEDGRVRFYDGFTISFDKGVPSSQALEIVGHVFNEAEPVYIALRENFTRYHKNAASPEMQRQIVAETRLLLLQAGFPTDDAARLQSKVFALRPTHAQIRTWITELPEDDPNRESLVELKAKYQKEWEELQGKLADIENAPLDIRMGKKLLQDTLNPDGNNQDTIPGVLSGGFRLIYKLKNKKMNVTGIELTPRFSEKNIYEDITGVQLLRPPTEDQKAF